MLRGIIRNSVTHKTLLWLDKRAGKDGRIHGSAASIAHDLGANHTTVRHALARLYQFDVVRRGPATTKGKKSYILFVFNKEAKVRVL